MRGPRTVSAALLLTVLASLATVCAPGLAPGSPGVAVATASAAAAAPGPLALRVRIDSLSPPYLSRGRDVVVGGRVTNTTDQTWHDVRAFLVMSSAPITSRESLAEAAASPPTEYFGDRVLGPPGKDLSDHLGTIRPGQTVPYTVDVPYDQLGISGASGVYWTGIQVLGTDAAGRDAFADGRARTFIPLPPASRRPRVKVAMLWPIEAAVDRRPRGRYANAADLARLMRDRGRLDHVVSLAASAGSVPLTLAVDPAVLDAAQHLSQSSFGLPVLRGQAPGPGGQTTSPTGSPSPTASSSPPSSSPAGPAGGGRTRSPRTPPSTATSTGNGTGPTTGPSTGPSGSASSSPGGGASSGPPGPATRTPTPPQTPSTSSPPPGTSGDGTPPRGPRSRVAEAWLTALVDTAHHHDLVQLPYGDPDLGALVHHGDRDRLLRRALRVGGAALARLGLPSVETAWPTSGVASKAMLTTLASAGVPFAVLSAVSLPDWSVGDSPTVALGRLDGSVTGLVLDPAAMAGGPRPGPTDTALQLRQRLLSETALTVAEASAAGRKPVGLVVSPPMDWDPGSQWPQADFFAGLHAPWLRFTGLRDLLQSGSPPYDGPYHYGREARAAELPRRVVRIADRLASISGTLAQLVGGNADVRRYYSEAAALAVSAQNRADPRTNGRLARQTLGGIRHRLGALQVEAPQFVTLSSDNGRFPITITNGSPLAVTVALRLHSTDPRVRIDPVPPATIQPQQKTTMLVDVHTTGIGLTTATARLATTGGRVFGPSTSLNLRTTSVGVVIWVIMGVAAVILFGAVLLRITRRVLARTRRRSAG